MKLALLLIPGLLWAQPQSSEKEKASLEGQVLNAVTGEPVRKANLTLMLAAAKSTPVSTASDANGKFSFAGVEPGSYLIYARHNRGPRSR